MQNQIIPHIIDQHAEEAAFLWLLRNNAIHAPHYDLKELAQLDERLEAHIDGLRIAGDYAWQVCLENLQFKESGEMFAAAMLAFESNDSEKIHTLYNIAEAAPETIKGLISALGWIDGKHLQGKVLGMLDAKNPLWRQVGIAACAIHRIDAGSYLEAAINDDNIHLRCRALKAAGELARVDLLKKIISQIEQEIHNIRFWAAWSGVLLGDRTRAMTELSEQVRQQTPFAAKAGQLLFRIIDSTTAKQYLSTLIPQQATRSVIQYIGILGEISYLPWLIEQMMIPELARVAGEAFSFITGIDMAYDDLEDNEPKNVHSGPTESADDEQTALDQDEDLPWPNTVLIQQWWEQHHTEFNPAKRYLLGKPISLEHCQYVLRKGQQRQRQAAALEIALMQPTAIIFETRANAQQQINNIQ